jgi:hypothetical protein
MTDMSDELPTDHSGWKEWFRDRIDEARLEPMSERDRKKLIAWLKDEVELLLFGPEPELDYVPDFEPVPESSWRDLGYR